VVWRIRAAIGAVAVGVAVAALVGDSASGGVELGLLAAAAVAILLTVVYQAAGRRRTRWRYEPVDDEPTERPRRPGKRTPRPTTAPRTTEVVAVERLSTLIGRREVQLLGHDGFGSPWLEEDVAHVRELARIEPLLGSGADPAVAAASRLVVAAAAFVRVYDETTAADPITNDGRWRVVAQPSFLPGLEDAAAELLRSHEALTSAVGESRPLARP
jgi:hypothetical protein